MYQDKYWLSPVCFEVVHFHSKFAYKQYNFKCYSMLHWSYDFYFNSIYHKVDHLCNSDTCKNTPSSSDSVVNIQFTWISSDFITRVVKVCRNLLEAATQIVNLEQVIDRIVKIFDALLYAQGEKSFKLACLLLYL